MSNFSSDEFWLQDISLPQADVASLAVYPVYRAAVYSWKILPPCILLLGGFGNIATIFVMRRIKDHNSSQRAIFMALAMSDLTLLCTDMTVTWIKQVFHVDLLHLHVAVCKVHIWVTHTSGVLSAWLVTFVTVQRTMAVLWPHRMRVMCTVRRTWIVIATLVLTACAFDFHLLLGMEIIQENRCYAMPGMYGYFYDFIFSWVYLCVASSLPSVCLFVCDILLSVALFKAVSSSSMAARGDKNNSSVHNTDTRKKTSYRTTVMVLAISCAFLVLTTPESVYMIWVPFANQEINQNLKELATAYFIHSVTCNLWYVNSAINFFLYILTGTKFRREFMNWIRCGGARSPSAPSVHETASEASKEGRHKHHGNRPLSK